MEWKLRWPLRSPGGTRICWLHNKKDRSRRKMIFKVGSYWQVIIQLVKPSNSIMHDNWSLSSSPANNGWPVSSSANMQPKDHISMGSPYLIKSGQLFTLCRYKFFGANVVEQFKVNCNFGTEINILNVNRDVENKKQLTTRCYEAKGIHLAPRITSGAR